jgi:hypothetical protein
MQEFFCLCQNEHSPLTIPYGEASNDAMPSQVPESIYYIQVNNHQARLEMVPLIFSQKESVTSQTVVLS